MATRKAVGKKGTAPGERVESIMKVERGSLRVHIVGSTPLILNRLSEKTKRELLYPSRMSVADRDRLGILKHDPLAEFRAAAHTLPDGPTLLGILSTAFKGALRTAALDMPGQSKAQIGRLTYVRGSYVGVYGIPQVFMAPVRNSGMDKTPDIRTRCIIPEWACELVVDYAQGLITPQAVTNLLASSGITVGVGDWRVEKGSGDYGQFSIVDPKDKDFVRIVKAGGRKAQVRAMEIAAPYDDETAELLTWFAKEFADRKKKGARSATPKPETHRTAA